MSTYELHYNKDTGNKFRWIADVDGVLFKLYIPQLSLPDPHPRLIFVSVESDPRQAAGVKANLKAVVEFVEEHTQTVHYAPVGDPETWQIGEPYIPKAVLSRPWPQQLHVAVSWEEC